ncbi:MAG TPA: UDP-N-acetylmuramoyl-L-alanine--D-glutamate ligase [Candidatus Limnocylindria bacterium]|nr:UDP-N-acetylmuramoyl-L-alanine--D-glutamate ligase [Candidatus Limnocylindria bacterium]
MTTTAHTDLRSPADLAGRRVLVLGLARSGIASVRFLVTTGAEVTVYDRRSPEELADAVARLEGLPIRFALAIPPEELIRLLGDAELVVTSPSISPRFPTTDPWLRSALLQAEARGVALLSEVDLFLRLTPSRVLAVTGTKGKTTTTSLVGAILAADGMPHLVGGNIGRPLLDHLDELGPDAWAVLELSELQLPTISRGADISLYTNITADHLDRHGTVEAYRAVKGRLAELARGPVVLNADDPGCRELAARLPKLEIAWYGGDEGRAALRDGWIVLDGEPLIAAEELQLPGQHMLHDALGAALAARLAGVASASIRAALRSFRGVPHRLETIAERRGVRYVNDSQATIPLATIAALQAFGRRRLVLIAGGQGKGLAYDELADAIVSHCAAVVLIGETADELERLIAGRIRVRRAASMDTAVAEATALAESGDVVLLSPAAASFDMFTDYAARGDAFRAAVAAIPETSTEGEP